jgi:hypothetical protein
VTTNAGFRGIWATGGVVINGGAATAINATTRAIQSDNGNITVYRGTIQAAVHTLYALTGTVTVNGGTFINGYVQFGGSAINFWVVTFNPNGGTGNSGLFQLVGSGFGAYEPTVTPPPGQVAANPAWVSDPSTANILSITGHTTFTAQWTAAGGGATTQVSTEAELLNALQNANQGDVIIVTGDVTMDENEGTIKPGVTLTIGSGVTLTLLSSTLEIEGNLNIEYIGDGVGKIVLHSSMLEAHNMTVVGGFGWIVIHGESNIIANLDVSLPGTEPHRIIASTEVAPVNHQVQFIESITAPAPSGTRHNEEWIFVGTMWVIS